jgi:hypothetical protein
MRKQKKGRMFGPSSTWQTLWVSLGVVVLMVVIMCAVPGVGALGYIWLIACALVAVYSAVQLLREKRRAAKDRGTEEEDTNV